MPPPRGESPTNLSLSVISTQQYDARLESLSVPSVAALSPLCSAAHVHFSPTLTNVTLLPAKGFRTGVCECHRNSGVGEGTSPVVFLSSCRQQSSSSLFSWIWHMGKKMCLLSPVYMGPGSEDVLIA